MDTHYLAEKLHLPGYHFTIRSALGGSDGGSCLQQLRHFFLTCTATGESYTTGFVHSICRAHLHMPVGQSQKATVMLDAD